MTEKVFLLGRPGSGKTTAFDHIRKYASNEKLRFTHHREYTILQEMMQSDDKNKFRPAKHGGFEVWDDSVFEESARHFEKRLHEYLTTTAEEEFEEFIFIELARKEYKESMRSFSPGFLHNSYFLFIEADVETCIKRIHARVAQSASTGNHFVPDNILRGYYSQDNIEYMASQFKTDFAIQKEVRTIDNRRSIEQFFTKVEDFAHLLIASYKSVAAK